MQNQGDDVTMASMDERRGFPVTVNRLIDLHERIFIQYGQGLDSEEFESQPIQGLSRAPCSHRWVTM